MNIFRKLEIRRFVKERDRVFTDAVLNDNWFRVREFAEKNKIPLSDREEVMQAGIYKAVQVCTKIPDDVKAVARRKCIALGFKPEMWGKHD